MKSPSCLVACMKCKVWLPAIAVGLILQLSEFADANETLGSIRLERDILLVEANNPREKFLELYAASLQRLKENAESLEQIEKVQAIEDEQANFEQPNRELNSIFHDLLALQKIYREKIVPIEDERIKAHNQIYAWYIKRLGELEEAYLNAGASEKAAEIRKEIDTSLEASFATALSGAGPFVEEFDAPLSPALWSWAPVARVTNGSLELNGTAPEYALKLRKPVSGDFKLEIVIERDGDHTWGWYDCGVHFTGVVASAGVRLADQDVNLVFVTPSPEGNGRPGNPDDVDVLRESHRGRGTESGTFTVTLRENQLIASFRDPRGRKIETAPLTVRDFDETEVVIFCGGVPNTPRRIHRVTLSRDFSESD